MYQVKSEILKEIYKENKKYLDEEDLKEIERVESIYPELNQFIYKEDRYAWLNKMNKQELIKYYCGKHDISKGNFLLNKSKDEVVKTIIYTKEYSDRRLYMMITFSNPRYFNGCRV